MDFWIDLENTAGVKQADGPIASAVNFRYTSRMDRVGTFSFAMPATDPKARAVQSEMIVRAYTMIDGQRVRVGAGVINNIDRTVGRDGKVTLNVSGANLLRELTYRSVLNLKLYNNGLPVSHAAALAGVGAFAPAGWTFTPDPSPPHNSVYAYFNGDTVASALIKLAEKSYTHFYGGIDRTATFASTFTPSGVRAIQARGELQPETCAITDLRQTIDTNELKTRIYPRGSGNAEVQLKLRATTRTAPAGYTLNAAQNYIENDAAIAAYGPRELQFNYREIGPIENTNADVLSASNALFDAALEELRRRSEELTQATYALRVAECSQLLRPMQTIRVIYRDLEAGLDIDQALNILESTWEISSDSGLRTTNLVVSNFDRWTASDAGMLVDDIEQGQVYQALPQLNANSYVTSYNKPVDETETASFRFRFGREVTQLQQVLFEFRLLPLESTVKSMGTETGGSGEVDTSGPNVDATGSGGNNETSLGGPTATATGGPTSTGSGGDGNTGFGGSGDTGFSGSGETGLSGTGSTGESGGGNTGFGGDTSTGGTGLSTFSTDLTDTQPGGTNSTGMGGSGNTGTGGPTATALGGTTTTDSGGGGSTGDTGLNTNAPQGGDINPSGRHTHNLTVNSGTSGSQVFLDTGGANPVFRASNGGVVLGTTIGEYGNHTHGINDHGHGIDPHGHTLSEHQHTIAEHFHSIAQHSHTINSHTHLIQSHTHALLSHTHSILSHSHTISAHSHTTTSHVHTGPSHVHTVSGHSHTIPLHSHTIAAHTHSITAHTHSMSQHTHSLNNHTHSLTADSIVAVYGIFRESALKTFALADLEYRVNSGTWFGLETSTSVSGNWRRLDITTLLQNSLTLRPLQDDNLLEIKRKTAGATGLTGQIDAQLSVRNIIQSIALV